MCECNIDSIERECNRSVGGVKPTVQLTCPEELVSIGAATDHAVSTITYRSAVTGPPAVAAGYFRTWNTSRKDADFKSDQDPETGEWKTEFKFFIPKQTAAKAAILNNLGEDNVIALVYDKNGAKRIVGELDNPANITVQEATTPKNGYIVTGDWTSQYSPYFFTGTPDVTP